MSYQEQRSVLIMAVGVAVFVVYFAVALTRFSALEATVAVDAAVALRFWARAMLILVPIAVVANVVAMILFAIFYRICTGEEIPDLEDERDRLIELKVNQVAQGLFLLGFFASMVPVAFGGTVAVMFLVIAGAGLVSQLVSETARIVMYRSGV